MRAFKCLIGIACAVSIGTISILIYWIVDEYHYEESTFRGPLINDVFKQHRKENNITIYEVNEIFLTFSNINTDQDDHIIFYTTNGSDPRKYGIPYDDNEPSEIGILVPISKIHDVHEPVTIRGVIGKLGTFDQIIWSKIENKTFWNPDHLNHTKFGAGFTQIPQILSGTHTIGYWFIVRVSPQRLTDIVKCAFSNNKDARIFTHKKVFWSDRYSSKTINISKLLPMKNNFTDIKFDNNYFKNWNGLIYVKCSTSSQSVLKTIKNVDHSSMLMPTKPKYTQLFPPNMHRLGKF